MNWEAFPHKHELASLPSILKELSQLQLHEDTTDEGSSPIALLSLAQAKAWRPPIVDTMPLCVALCYQLNHVMTDFVTPQYVPPRPCTPIPLSPCIVLTPSACSLMCPVCCSNYRHYDVLAALPTVHKALEIGHQLLFVVLESLRWLLKHPQAPQRAGPPCPTPIIACNAACRRV